MEILFIDKNISLVVFDNENSFQNFSRDLFPYKAADNHNTDEKNDAKSDLTSCYDVNKNCCSMDDCNYNITQQVEGFINKTNVFR